MENEDPSYHFSARQPQLNSFDVGFASDVDFNLKDDSRPIGVSGASQ
ncbi:hypothetical protein ARSEF1564_010341, partial [Beauveria bassiana]